MYTIVDGTNFVTRVADGASIPLNPDNSDYVNYLAWVAEGNTAEILPEPHPTRAELAALAANRETLIAKGNAYLALSSPTAAQNTKAIRALVMLQLEALTDISGT